VKGHLPSSRKVAGPITTLVQERNHPITMGPTIVYVPSAGRAFRHTLAEDVAKRPVRARRRFLRR
jgi:hypothetical protein